MKKQYFVIAESKRQKIEKTALAEFSAHFYYEASLNNIVKQSGISKGGLFKYINSKEDLYLYLYQKYLNELVSYQADNLNAKTTDFLERIKELAHLSLLYYQQNEHVYNFILNGLTDYSAVVYKRVIGLKNEVLKNYHNQLLKGINFKNYHYSKQQMLEIYEWISTGINASIKNTNTIEDILAKLDMLVEVLKFGVMRR